MLEYSFNELDSDFVVLWSKYLVSGEASLIFEDLTKLAELGQLNAVQSWYLFAKNKDSNNVIDDIVANLRDTGANELLAKAHCDYFNNNRVPQIKKWVWYYSNRGYLNQSQEDEFNDLWEELLKSDYFRGLDRAIGSHYGNYERVRNILMLERYYELVYGLPRVYKKILQVNYKSSIFEFNKLRKELLKMYEQDKGDIAVAFALAKNLTLFKSNEKLKMMGSNILEQLANRGYSQTFRDYEVKGTNRLIKQQIDENAEQQKLDTNANSCERSMFNHLFTKEEYDRIVKESKEVDSMRWYCQ